MKTEPREGMVFRIPLFESDGLRLSNDATSRHKFIVVLGTDQNGNILAGVVFNSRINPRLPQWKKRLHLPIRGSDYPFLSHDSYIDCSYLFKLRKERVTGEELLGSLSEQDYRKAITLLHTNDRIDPLDFDDFRLFI